MKSLEPLQYDCLCAVARKDNESIYRLGELLEGNGYLHQRGLYTYTPIAPGSVRGVPGSANLTQAGHDAIMCYRALKSDFSFT